MFSGSNLHAFMYAELHATTTTYPVPTTSAAVGSTPSTGRRRRVPLPGRPRAGLQGRPRAAHDRLQWRPGVDSSGGWQESMAVTQATIGSLGWGVSAMGRGGLGCYCKNTSTSGGWRAAFCKLFPHLSLSFVSRCRYDGADQSLHILHRWGWFRPDTLLLF
jgi:hypothetical protein